MPTHRLADFCALGGRASDDCERATMKRHTPIANVVLIALTLSVAACAGTSATPPVGRATLTATSSSTGGSAITWPFKPGQNQQWAVINGYRGNDDHHLGGSPNNYALFALDFAICASGHVTTQGCDLPSGWANTVGEPVYAPVAGVVGWAQSSCHALALDIAGNSGYRVTLAHIDLLPGETWSDLQQNHTRFAQGQQIGTVSAGGCIGTGNHIHMALYSCSACDSDPAQQRVGHPFSGDWSVGSCSFPDDGATANEFVGDLVPCQGSAPVYASATATAGPPAPGTVLYRADWSHGMDGWVGSSGWRVVNGEMVNDGSDCCDVFAPDILGHVADYSVRARIQVNQGTSVNFFSLVARGKDIGNGLLGYDTGGYDGGVDDLTSPGAGQVSGQAFISHTGETDLAGAPFDPNLTFHDYRLDVRGNVITLFIDGQQIAQTSDSTYPDPGRVGLRADNTSISVTAFVVIAL